ncbi:hypothetical protein [Pseudoalteromonas piscicida]|uniref:hypothetical protein n=1 Tax=Pseudoalteromonas piscicida TaxID=43662 RepID=UPI00309F0E34
MIQKLKGKLGKTIFTYWVFWAFILIPIILSLILMCAIATGDALEFTKITKASLDTFIEYQKVPLVILGLSIPFGTLAAANFRAKQFHRNLERQEYEHQIDLYQKELNLFEKKFEGAIEPEKFTYVHSRHATIVFSRSRKYPEKGCLFDPTPIVGNGNYLAILINPALEYLNNIFLQNKDEKHLQMVDMELFTNFIEHLDRFSNTSQVELEVLTFMTKFRPKFVEIGNLIGIDHPQPDAGFVEYCQFLREAISVVSVVYELYMLETFPLADHVWRNRMKIAERCTNFKNSELKISTIAEFYKLN